MVRWGIYNRTAQGNYQRSYGYFKTKKAAKKKLESLEYKSGYYLIKDGKGLIDGSVAQKKMMRKKRK